MHICVCVYVCIYKNIPNYVCVYIHTYICIKYIYIYINISNYILNVSEELQTHSFAQPFTLAVCFVFIICYPLFGLTVSYSRQKMFRKMKPTLKSGYVKSPWWRICNGTDRLRFLFSLLSCQTSATSIIMKHNCFKNQICFSLTPAESSLQLQS